MRIVFLGSSHYGECSLRRLVEDKYDVACVVTQPDKKKGRGLHIGSTKIKDVAKELRLKVFQPENINAQDSVRFLRDLGADLAVVIAYGQMLSQEVIDIPKIMTTNIHASLLPYYRGAAPINWAVIKGEKVTGNTLMKVTLKMDSGPVIRQLPREILNEDTAVTLEEKLCVDAAELLADGLKLICSNKHVLTEQEESKATYAPKLKKENGLIDWDKSPQEVYDLFRGTLNWPGAFTVFRGMRLKVCSGRALSVSDTNGAFTPGQVVRASKEGIIVSCRKGLFLIEELQIEGKKRMTVKDFIAGHKINVSDKLGM